MEIRNKQDFATLAWIRGEWELKVSGKRVANGKLPASEDGAAERGEDQSPEKYSLAAKAF